WTAPWSRRRTTARRAPTWPTTGRSRPTRRIRTSVSKPGSCWATTSPRARTGSAWYYTARTAAARRGRSSGSSSSSQQDRAPVAAEARGRRPQEGLVETRGAYPADDVATVVAIDQHAARAIEPVAVVLGWQQ